MAPDGSPSCVSQEQLRDWCTQVATHNDTISWERFYHYLVAISLLGIAWATVYSANHDSRESVLLWLGALGVLLSFLWAFMGVRSRRYLDMYNLLALRAEIGDATYEELMKWLKDGKHCVRNTRNKKIYEEIGLLPGIYPALDNRLRVERLKAGFWTRITSSTALLRFVPVCFAILFVILTQLTFAAKVYWWEYLIVILVLLRFLVRGAKPDPLAELEQP